MKIAVLAKPVPDTWGRRRLDPRDGLLVRTASETILDEVGGRALEVALLAKDADSSIQVAVIAMAPSGNTRDLLLKCVAMGADSAVHILDDALAGSDALVTSHVLAEVLRAGEYHVILAGNESTDGRGGVVPAMIAERLGMAHITHANELTLDTNGVRGRRQTEYGTVDVHAQLPVVASITEGGPEPRFPGLKGTFAARKKPFDTVSPRDDGLANGSVVTGTSEAPARHAGVRVVDDGTASEQLIEFLIANDQL